MENRRPILITGSHRSGSTWVGRMIALCPGVGYIHEPFHLRHSPGVCTAKFDLWFPYIIRENEHGVEEALRRTLAFSYDLKAGMRSAQSIRDRFRVFRDCRGAKKARGAGLRPLIKDPLALFSAPWLAERFGMEVVVLIRHPAAFAASLKRLHWTHPFGHFIRQPLLMRDWLEPFRDEIERFERKERDILDQAILLWNLIHHTIDRFRKEHADWIFPRHEDLARDPVGQFCTLISRLDLEMTLSVRKAIEHYSSGANPIDAPSGGDSLLRDSASLLESWKTRLSSEEIERIRRGTEHVASLFYSDADW